MKIPLSNIKHEANKMFFLKTSILVKLTLILSFATAIGCATKPLNYSKKYFSKTQKIKQGQWEAKVLVKNKKNSQKYTVDLSVNAIYKKKLRLDITSLLMGHIASLTLNNNKLEYILTQQNKYYSGTSNQQSMQRLLSLPINPQLLYNLFFFKSIELKSWICQNGENFLQSCQRLQDQLTITWKKSRSGFGNIFIEHSKASVIIKIKNFQPYIAKRKNLFRLKQ